MAGDDGVDELQEDVAELESGAMAACSVNSVAPPAPDGQNAAATTTTSCTHTCTKTTVLQLAVLQFYLC